MKKAISPIFILIVLSILSFKTISKRINSDAGTTFTIINQVNGLVDYMYGDCQPLPAGQIMPSKSITVFVKSGSTQKMSFRGPFSAGYCHCAVKMLTGNAQTQSLTVTLSYGDFCDHH